jgi:hypothetical protein
MRTITKTLYEFSELSEEAQEKAITDFQCHENYFWQSENEDTLNAFVKIFPEEEERADHERYRN